MRDRKQQDKIEHMFEDDLTSLPTVDLLESAVAHRAEVNRLEARLLEHAQIYADRYHPDACRTRPGRPFDDGRERAVVLGGDGCPEIAEFAPAEFGVMLGISPGAAADYIGQALALRHRFPFTWARVLAGEATPWKARKIATACLELSQEAAKTVDQRVAKVVDSLTPGRLDKIVEAAKKHADPDAARAKAEEKKRERGVYVGRSDEHGTKKIFIRTGSGHAIRFNARITSIAEALKILGDTASLQSRRADAVGIIADPRYTEELLHQAHQHLRNTTPEPPPPTEVADKGYASPTTQTAGASTGPATPQNTGGPRDQSTAQPTAATDPGATRIAGPTKEQRTALVAAQTFGAPIGPVSAPDTCAAKVQSTDRATPETTGVSIVRGIASTADPAADQGGAPMTGGGRTTTCGWVIDGDATTAGPPPARTNALPAAPDRGGVRGDLAHDGRDSTGWTRDDDLLTDWPEPDLDEEADREAAHPSHGDLPGPFDAPFAEVVEPFDPGPRLETADGEPLDAEARRVLDARLAQIRYDAHANPRSGRQLHPGQTEIYVHLTDHTLATGTGVLRAEDIGPLLATQLTELIGHAPYTVKPVIDLNDAVSVDAYEIPERIRERVRLTHPVELFPYGTRETHPAMDLDHIQPYDPLGPPGQTNTSNLAPLRRFPHRVKTHGRWKVRRLDPRTLEWTTPNGFTFHIDPTGTHRAPQPTPDA
ncbi:DUF222 domain-containing protein [Kribbella sp. NPDC002412]